MAALIISPLQLHFSTIIIAIFVILPTFLASNTTTKDYYRECSPLVSCGNISNIGYPFWGDKFRPEYCGHSGFQLVCPPLSWGKHPMLLLQVNQSLESFEVLDIDSSTMTIVLQDFERTQYLAQCIFPSSSLTKPAAAEDLIEYSARVENISLLYDCQPNVAGALARLKNFTCPTDQGYSGMAYYWKNHKSNDELDKFCQSIETPVLGKDDLKRGSVTLKSVLEKGFELNYSKIYLRDCSACQRSGGACGFSTDVGFLCYCKGWESHSNCWRSGSSKLKMSVILIGSGVGIGAFTFIVLILRKRSLIRKLPTFWKGRTTENQNAEAFLRIYGSLAPKRYTYSSIKTITNSFTDKLGEGGYATVYKGKLGDGGLVAVKLFKLLKGNGEDFINEVASIGRTNHVNIVSLLGFCFEGKKRALIYEFMSNGSLEKFTFRNGSNGPLPWEMIFNIAQGIAKGLDYLHRGCNDRILHLDIKPHNILLDEQFNPKISDFGLARLCPLQESSISMLEARGTIGYIAPEVFCRSFGSVSHKSDVYSYGMMVVDLVCGRTNTSANVQCSSELDFPHWIYEQLDREGEMRLDEMEDDEEKCSQRKMILVSLWCIQTYPSSRPSMNRVVELLNGSLESIPMPPRPCLSPPPRLLSIPSSGTLSPE